MNLLIERKECTKCSTPVIHLVNDMFCMRCYQSNYYRTVTKKRKKKKRAPKAWWMQYYK